MDHPVYNPPIPYTGYICGGFRPGRIVRIQGKVNPAAISFSINLQCGPSTSLNDIALHLNPRLTENTVIRNSRNYSSWGIAERIRGMPFPFIRGQNFEVIIICDEQQFKISINGQHFTEYNHRVPVERISNISVDGDVTVSLIQFAGTSPPGATTYSPPYATANDSRMSPMNFVQPSYPQESNSPVHYPPNAYSPPTGPSTGYGNQAPGPYLQQAGGFQQQQVGCSQQSAGVYAVPGTGLLQGYQTTHHNKSTGGLLDNVGKLIAGGLAAVGLTKATTEKKRGRPPNPENLDANGQKIAKRKIKHEIHQNNENNIMHMDHFNSSATSDCTSVTTSPGPSSSMQINGTNCLTMSNPEFWQKHHQDPTTVQKPKRKPRVLKNPKAPRIPRNKISKKLEQKQKRCKGEAYVSRSTKKLVEARKIKPSTCVNCPNNCKRWTEVERKMIFEHFWGIADDTRQKDWILAHVKLVQVKRKRTTSDRRNFSYKYYLPRGVEGDMAVCKKFFLSTLGYGEGALNYALRNAGETRHKKKGTGGGAELSGIDQLLGVPTAASLSGPSAAAVLGGITAAAALSNIAAEAARSASAKTLAKKSSGNSEHNSVASSIASENSNSATLTEESAVEAISAAAAALIRIPYVEKVQLFLRTIPVLAPHNCRTSSSQMYFHTEVSDFDTLFRMYRRHCEENRIEKVSKVTFNRVVTNFDVKIHHPKKDKCAVCIKYGAMPKPLERYKRHIRDQQITKDVLLIDRKSSGTKGSLTASLDVQKVIPSPNGDSPEFFCSRKHHTHNLTIFESKTRIVTCYLWGETEGTMTGIEISTCLHKWLKAKDATGKYTSIILNMHDVPGGQCGNKMVYTMLYYFINNSKWINKVEIKFYLNGHKYVPSESPHAAVEKNLRRSKTFSYTEWPALIRNSRSRCSDYNVHRLLYDDFEDWNYEMNNRIMFAKSHTRGEWVKWKEIRYVRIEKYFDSEFIINYNLNAPLLLNPAVKYNQKRKALAGVPKKKWQKVQVFPRRRGRPRKVRIPVVEDDEEDVVEKIVDESEGKNEDVSTEVDSTELEKLNDEADTILPERTDEEFVSKDLIEVHVKTDVDSVVVELVDSIPDQLIVKTAVIGEELTQKITEQHGIEIVIDKDSSIEKGKPDELEGDGSKKAECSTKKERIPKPPPESPDLTVKIFGPTLEKAAVNFEIQKAYSSPLPISYDKYKDLKDLCDQVIIPKEFHAEFFNLPYMEGIVDRLNEPDITETDDESDQED